MGWLGNLLGGGIVSSVESRTLNKISIGIRDKKEQLNVPLQSNLIETNGVDDYWDFDTVPPWIDAYGDPSVAKVRTFLTA